MLPYIVILLYYVILIWEKILVSQMDKIIKNINLSITILLFISKISNYIFPQTLTERVSRSMKMIKSVAGPPKR